MITAGCHSAANLRFRPTMEDKHYWAIGGDKAYFGVFDGHAGSGCATWCAKNMHQVLERNVAARRPNETLDDVISRTYAECDATVCKSETSGATGSVVYISGRTLYCSNVGDSHAVLCGRGRAHRLTAEHRTTNSAEVRRLVSSGGEVRGGRAQGVLSVTRALGNPQLKPYVTARPFVMHRDLEPDDDMLIIATDGLWDVCAPQAAADLIAGVRDPREAARLLVQSALLWGSADNVTVVVVYLHEQRRIPSQVLALTPPAHQELPWPAIHREPDACRHSPDDDSDRGTAKCSRRPHQASEPETPATDAYDSIQGSLEKLSLGRSAPRVSPQRPRKISVPLVFDDLDSGSDAVADD